MNLADRIEAATADQQRELLEEAWREIIVKPYMASASVSNTVPLRVKSHLFETKLKAEAYLDAAMMLVGKDWYVEIKGPRRYLNIPTPVPNYWSANLETWNHEEQKMGWGSSPALALAAAAIRAKGIDDAD